MNKFHHNEKSFTPDKHQIITNLIRRAKDPNPVTEYSTRQHDPRIARAFAQLTINEPERPSLRLRIGETEERPAAAESHWTRRQNSTGLEESAS